MDPSKVAEVLYRISTSQTDALQRGLRDRQRISDAIARGEQPLGHRVDWIRDSAMELNQTLMECARRFNERYPSDKASVQDLADVLATLMAAYEAESKQ
jgi:hypothetical protein